MTEPVAEPKAEPAPLTEPGVYFDMPEEKYHADPALGSTDIKELLYGAQAYYATCKLSPFFERDETEKRAFLIGRAFHTLVLMGTEAFCEGFQMTPNKDDPFWVRTIDDMRRWLLDHKEFSAPSKWKKDDYIVEIRRQGGAEYLFDDYMSEAKGRGVRFLREEDFQTIVQAGNALAANKYLVNAITNGEPEVSIFWEEDIAGIIVRRKARIDWLRMRASIDLKSVGGRRGRDFRDTCIKSMINYRYDIQAAAYNDARAAMAGLVKEGKVYGKHDPEWLKGVANVSSWAFVFIFWSTTRTPMTHSIMLSPQNPILVNAHGHVNKALHVYAENVRLHGFNEPWVTPAPIEELQPDDVPSYAFT